MYHQRDDPTTVNGVDNTENKGELLRDDDTTENKSELLRDDDTTDNKGELLRDDDTINGVNGTENKRERWEMMLQLLEMIIQVNCGQMTLQLM